MKISQKLLLVVGVLALVAVASGCRGPGTFNMYSKISVLDFQVSPQIQGRVAPITLDQLKETSTRWIQATGRFPQVLQGAGNDPQTVYVQGTIHAYRQHRIGKAVVTAFTGVDIRGESLIDYRFFDAAGRTLAFQRVHARYRRAAPGMDPTAEEAGYQLSRVVAWHKDPYPPAPQ